MTGECEERNLRAGRAVVLGVVAALCATGGIVTATPGTLETWANPIAGKNFPLLAMIERDPAARRQIADDPALRAALDERRSAVERSASACATDVRCHAGAFSWSEADVARVRTALVRLATREGGLRRLVADQLRPSGMVERHRALADEELAGRAWDDTAKGLNHIIATYALGEEPRYPAIDSISHDAQSDTYGRLINVVTNVLNDDRGRWQLFYQPSLAFALRLLEVNWRDEAGRHEPLREGENAPAYRRISSVTWTDFPYTVIVVPGAGTDRPDVSLSPSAKMRLQLAVKRFRDGQAPFLLVSGGYVHPNQTRFNEALEMKRALVELFDVPEDAVLVDPHARHTTTNLRNAARVIHRYGIPADRLSLITTDQYQSEYIESATFQERCDRELGYRPHELKRRLSKFDLEWMPRREALHADALDPLDPH